MRVLIFGASSIQGFWDTQGGWADRLKQFYDEQQFKDFTIERPHVMNLGVSGDTTAELLSRLKPEAKARNNDKGISIIIQIGANNAAEEKGHTRSTPEEFKTELGKIIQEAASLTDKVLIVGFQAVDESLTNPVAWRPIFYKNKNIKIFEEAAAKVSTEMDIPFVPVHDKYLEISSSGQRLQAHDGLHPNDAGHQLIFELVRPALDKLLNT
jgi:lysophospholipase L1-like esterase